MSARLRSRVLRVWASVQRNFARNSGFILLLFVMNHFTLAWSLSLTEEFAEMARTGSALFVWANIVAWLMHKLFPASWVPCAKRLVLCLCFLPFAVELFVMCNYHALIGAGIVSSILETNLSEAMEFVEMYVGWRELLAVGVAIAALIVGWHLWERIHVSHHRQNRLVALAALLLVAMPIPALVNGTTSSCSAYECVPWQRACSALLTAYENERAYRMLADKVHADVKITHNGNRVKNFVFILGESTNRNHMQLYGYYLPNSPHLLELQGKGELAVFTDVIAPHSTTIAVLGELFTFCDHESDRPWYAYDNLVDIMRAAGYKTFWLSNQESSGIWGNVAQLFANHSSYHRFTHLRESREDTGILDEELFPLIDEAKAQRSPDHNFFVLHLMGGHGLYYNRYPYNGYHRFTASDIKLDIAEHLRLTVAEYDNALLYNDYIVSSIIDKFRDDEALIVYVPDHAEAVYEEGFAGHIEENPNRHMIEIPMIVWASKSFKAKHPETWERICGAVDRPYETDDLIHTLLDLADVATADYRPAKSVVNENFDAERPRIFNDLDYDTQIRTMSR